MDAVILRKSKAVSYLLILENMFFYFVTLNIELQSKASNPTENIRL